MCIILNSRARVSFLDNQFLNINIEFQNQIKIFIRYKKIKTKK